MEKIFTRALHEQLRKKVRGYIKIHIIDDTLIVDIRKNEYTSWRYTITNLAVQLSVGLSSRIVADVIVKQYKKYILNTYFH